MHESIDFRPFGKNVSTNMFEVHITQLQVDENLLSDQGCRPNIEPLRWHPRIMSFCRFFGLSSEVHASRPAESDFMKFAGGGYFGAFRKGSGWRVMQAKRE